jgi:hypothetical protein
MAIAVIFEFVAWVLCIGFPRCVDGKDNAVVALYKAQHKEVTGMEVDDVVGASVQDLAAMGVGKQVVESDDEDASTGCMMHQSDKVLKKITGKLVSTANKKAVDPFPEMVAILQKHHDRAVEFSYGTRKDVLLGLCKTHGLAEVLPKVDKTEVRVAAQYEMVLGQLRIWKANDAYVKDEVDRLNGQRPESVKKIKDERDRMEKQVVSRHEWEVTAEVEGLANVVRWQSRLAQTDSNNWTGAFGPYIVRAVSKKLAAGAAVGVIDLHNLKDEPKSKLPRKPVKYAELTPLGKEAMKRGALEHQKRFPNATKQLTGREAAMTLLDARLKHGPHLTDEEKEGAEVQLLAWYVDFGVQASKRAAADAMAAAALYALNRVAAALNAAYHAGRAVAKAVAASQPQLPQAVGPAGGAGADLEIDPSCHDDDECVPAGGQPAGCASDSDDDFDPDQFKPQKFGGASKSALKSEGKKAIAQWKEMSVNWMGLYPGELQGAPANLHPMEHLFGLDLGVLMRAIDQEERERVQGSMARRYGHIPLMAECHLGNRMASSFVERVNSAAKLLLGDRRGNLTDDELEMICILRVNRNFMEYMYKHHSGLLTK